MGRYTLVVYLCDGFFVRYAEYAGWFEWAPEHDGPALLAARCFAVTG